MAANSQTPFLSASTKNLLKRMPIAGATLLQLMQILVKVHKEYGDSKHEGLFQYGIAFLRQQTAIRLTKYIPDEWGQKVTQITNPPLPTFSNINGRMFLISAILLEFEEINAQLTDYSKWLKKMSDSYSDWRRNCWL